MNPPKIIGFTGLSGSGKSYAASVVQECYPSYRLFSFAHEIKRLARFYMGWNGEKDERGRKLLQDLGMAGRAYDPQLWVSFMPPDRLLVIDDVRFKNEFEAIRENGGIVIRIVRDNIKQMYHVSEMEGLQVRADLSVVNEGTPLFKDNLLHELGLRYGSNE